MTKVVFDKQMNKSTMHYLIQDLLALTWILENFNKLSGNKEKHQPVFNKNKSIFEGMAYNI